MNAFSRPTYPPLRNEAVYFTKTCVVDVKETIFSVVKTIYISVRLHLNGFDF